MQTHLKSAFWTRKPMGSKVKVLKPKQIGKYMKIQGFITSNNEGLWIPSWWFQPNWNVLYIQNRNLPQMGYINLNHHLAMNSRGGQKNWTPHHLMIPSTLIVNNPPFPSCWSNQTHSFTASQIHQRQLCRALAECNGENGTGKMRWGIGAVRGIKKYIYIINIYKKMVNFLGCLRDPFEGCWWPPAIGAQVGSLSILGCV